MEILMDNLTITILSRLIISSIVGIIIGIERTIRGKSAGVATFSIICITSCFLTLMSIYGFGNNSDPSRLIANIITAIGFVAGGVIFTIEKNNKRKVSGLTTGAIIFCVASLGIGIGLGMHIAVLTVVVLIEVNINIAILVKSSCHKKQKTKNNDEDTEYNEDNADI